jgi:hypothetical protein
MAPEKAVLARRLDRVGPFFAELGLAPVFYSLDGPLDLLDPELLQRAYPAPDQLIQIVQESLAEIRIRN